MSENISKNNHQKCKVWNPPKAFQLLNQHKILEIFTPNRSIIFFQKQLSSVQKTNGQVQLIQLTMFVEQGYYSTIMVDKRHEVTSTETAW